MKMLLTVDEVFHGIDDASRRYSLLGCLWQSCIKMGLVIFFLREKLQFLRNISYIRVYKDAAAV